MKIGTDSVLLGSFVTVSPTATNILDIGTGTGLLALMLAQKSKAQIDAVEIDEPAYRQASANFKSSVWHQQLLAHHGSLQDFKTGEQNLYDVIISNPPFYHHQKNLPIARQQRSNARHTVELPFEELALHVNRLLKPEGKFWLILPVQEGEAFIAFARAENLHVHTLINIQPKPDKKPNRMIICLGKTALPLQESTFCIYDETGKATREYYELTKDYLLWET